jgi:hypothetical protein
MGVRFERGRAAVLAAGVLLAVGADVPRRWVGPTDGAALTDALQLGAVVGGAALLARVLGGCAGWGAPGAWVLGAATLGFGREALGETGPVGAAALALGGCLAGCWALPGPRAAVYGAPGPGRVPGGLAVLWLALGVFSCASWAGGDLSTPAGLSRVWVFLHGWGLGGWALARAGARAWPVLADAGGLLVALAPWAGAVALAGLGRRR